MTKTEDKYSGQGLNKRDIGRDILSVLAAFPDALPEALEDATLIYSGHQAITYPDAKAGVKVAKDKLTEAQKAETAADIRAFVKDAYPPRDAAEVKLNTTLLPKRQNDLDLATRKAIAVGYASKELARDMTRALGSPETSLAIESIYLDLWEAVHGNHDDKTFRAVIDMREQAVRALPLLGRVYAASVSEGATPQEKKRLAHLWAEFGAEFPSMAVVRESLYGEAQAKVVEIRKAQDEADAIEKTALENAAALAAAARQGQTDIAVKVAEANAARQTQSTSK